MSPHPQGVSKLEAQKQSQPGSLEGVGGSSLPCPPNHKDALLAWPPSTGTDDPRPLCGSRTGCGVAGATTDQPGAQATFSFASTRLPHRSLKASSTSLDGGTLTPLLAKPSSGHPSLSHPLTTKQFMEEGVALGAQDLHAPRHSPTANLHPAFKVRSGPVLIHPTEKNPKCVQRLSYGLLSAEI